MTSPRTLTIVRTDAGRVRAANEDAFASRPDIGLWAVADGMGGHKNGRMASDIIVETLAGVGSEDGIEALCRGAADAVHGANARIYAVSTSLGEPMGSTVAGLLLHGDHFAVLWAGDSRVYLLRSGRLIQLTRDHTQVQDLIDRGLLGAEEAVGHPMGHVLSRAVGVETDLELDVIVDRREDGDVFLLCSDGLHGVLSEEEIRSPLVSGPLEAAGDQLLARCLAAGAPDNVTLIAVTCEPPTVLILGGDEISHGA